MTEYKVKVYADRTEWFNQEGELHREDGPAIEYASGSNEYASGSKAWYLKGEKLSEAEFNKTLTPDPCDGKVIEVDGKKYKLVSEN